LSTFDHNPAPATTAPRGIVIDEPGSGRGGERGKEKPFRPGGGKRQEPDLNVDANVFGDEVIYRLLDDLLVPAIVEQIVQDVLNGKERPECK
jgi:hypothetical protein